jgi:hypothetical protein
MQARRSAATATWPVAGRRLIATALGWTVAIIASLPISLTAVWIAALSGASRAQIILGLHLPTGLLAGVSIAAVWRRVVGRTTTFGRALRVTLPTMVAVAGLEAVKATLPAIGYLGVTVLQLAFALVPLTMRGLPGAVAGETQSGPRGSVPHTSSGNCSRQDGWAVTQLRADRWGPFGPGQVGDLAGITGHGQG